MNALHSRLEQLYQRAHARPLPDPMEDAMAPPDRLAPAAVLIAVTERDDPGVLVTHRPHTMRKHPGQAAFPGGRLDPGETPVEAALREAQEELGIDPRDVRVIGETDRFRTRTGFDITPVLATIPADLPLVPNPAEVAEWFEPPFRYILDPANQQEQEVHWEGAMRRYTEIHWQGHRIWGVTAAIIVNLTRRLALAERDA
ncbi:MAG: CoA pyrophosphatase [Sphingomonadaceae bacterium]|nr:CoA pyrophosphatase [Sphingomonadaceae bacterium]